MTTTTLIDFDEFVLETVETALAARGVRLRHCTTGEIEPLGAIGNGHFARQLADLSVLYVMDPIDPVSVTGAVR